MRGGNCINFDVRDTVRYLMELLERGGAGSGKLVRIFIKVKYCPQKEETVPIAKSCWRQHSMAISIFAVIIYILPVTAVESSTFPQPKRRIWPHEKI